MYSANEKVKEIFSSDFLDLNVGTEDTALFDSNLQISTLRQNLSKEPDENLAHVAGEFFRDLETRVDAR